MITRTNKRIMSSVLAWLATVSPIPAFADEGRETVTIRRDAYGVPHVFADNRKALFYGFGFALAEDRLFQTEMTKRTARGTVSEVLGSQYLASDKASRSNYDPISIRRQYEALSEADRMIFEGYAAGYNARVAEVLAKPDQLLPQEFERYGFLPSNMSVDDLLAIFLHDFMIRFSGYNGELDNLRLLTALGERHSENDAIAIFKQLRWETDSKTPTTIATGEGSAGPPPTFEAEERLRAVLRSDSRPAFNSAARLRPLDESAFAVVRGLRALTFGGTNQDDPPHASLGWTSGRAKTSGASATYVDGAQMGFTSPSPVWGVGLHGAGYDLEGYTLVGIPLVLFGTNGKIAWGGTAGMGDVVDMYQEVLNPNNSREYLYNGKYVPFEVREETINVKGEEPVTIEVFSSVHGLVETFDHVNGTAYTEKRAWQGYEFESLLGWLGATQQTNFEDFKAQTARWGISSNWLYADNQGQVSYIYTARYPDRPKAQDFRLPAIGTGEMEWQGFRPFSENPTVAEPSAGWLASWNNLPRAGYHSSDSIYWSEVDHVAEIQERIRAHPEISPRQMWDIAEEVAFIDGNARVLKPILMDVLKDESRDSVLGASRETLAAWDNVHSDADGNGYYDQTGQAVFREWLTVAQADLFSKDVPLEFLEPLGLTKVAADFPTLGTKVLAHTLLGNRAGVPQNFDFLNGQGVESFVRRTLLEAIERLKQRHGPDMERWKSPVLKHEFSTTNFVGVPITTPDRAVDLPQYMNRATFKFWVSFGSQGEASMCDVFAPGQSAFQSSTEGLSEHTYDQLPLFADFECKERPLTLPEIQGQQVSQRTLTF